MPTYDYHCTANDRTVEVKHPMSATVRTWGELCALAGLPMEATPAETPVAKKLAATSVGGTSKASSPAPSMRSVGGCGSSACGHRH